MKIFKICFLLLATIILIACEPSTDSNIEPELQARDLINGTFRIQKFYDNNYDSPYNNFEQVVEIWYMPSAFLRPGWLSIRHISGDSSNIVGWYNAWSLKFDGPHFYVKKGSIYEFLVIHIFFTSKNTFHCSYIGNYYSGDRIH